LGHGVVGGKVTRSPTTPAAAVMSVAGEGCSEGSEGEEVFIDDEDIINEIPLDEQGIQMPSSYTITASSLSLILLARSLLFALLRSPRPRR
jgi:hypothetical protein